MLRTSFVAVSTCVVVAVAVLTINAFVVARTGCKGAKASTFPKRTNAREAAEMVFMVMMRDEVIYEIDNSDANEKIDSFGRAKRELLKRRSNKNEGSNANHRTDGCHLILIHPTRFSSLSFRYIQYFNKPAIRTTSYSHHSLVSNAVHRCRFVLVLAPSSFISSWSICFVRHSGRFAFCPRSF